ncbi:Alpha/Beta hydrolase protein [Cladorrhinum sp. PSN332]|nr:Alpha/Beta hydrolase protein [Cladorrhinum sp. PSN332]
MTTPHDTFASHPYEALFSPDSSTPIAYHKPSLPYTFPPHHPLQTLTLYIPFGSSLPSSSYIPRPKNPTWLIYIHGGAWRDPLIDSLSFTPTVLSLLASSPPENLTGIISLNYRLSPHPSHPESGNHSQHPDHISDILTALSFLHPLGIYPKITIGHSCGATLAFQSVMSPSRWGLTLPASQLQNPIPKPHVIIGLNGLYDLSGFISNPPRGFESLVPPYREFVTGAFGTDEKAWRDVCPTSCEGDWLREWTESKTQKKKRKVVLVQSREDGLVPHRQLEGLRERIEAENGKEEGVEIEVQEVDGEGWGGHDEVWKRGDKLAELLKGVLGVLE